jgi:hypothetical protein
VTSALPARCAAPTELTHRIFTTVNWRPWQGSNLRHTVQESSLARPAGAGESVKARETCPELRLRPICSAPVVTGDEASFSEGAGVARSVRNSVRAQVSEPFVNSAFNTVSCVVMSLVDDDVAECRQDVCAKLHHRVGVGR